MEWISQWLDQMPNWVDYLVILVLTGIVYETTFARSLPLLKNIVVYIFLALGCYLLLIFHILRFPIIPALFITILLIIVTKWRLAYSKRGKTTENVDP
ncbi:YlaH-like protein [Seinonella peptonophila]|uniref:YlaH-like protein n=1 Tax=Seinonella peptonophila TaxID=112248 RepID=A0A1M4V1C2_9BACL|nr:YlaH-like family protein [Seinonella peptonophila]SHE62673.1 YlaH-like protein [Seinonella peptonophila]